MKCIRARIGGGIATGIWLGIGPRIWAGIRPGVSFRGSNITHKTRPDPAILLVGAMMKVVFAYLQGLAGAMMKLDFARSKR